jgi:eukaryotic-like serine/threonine-protein kinase
VTVFDCGIDDGSAFIVMELVAGRTLRAVLDEAGSLPPAQAAGIAAAVCEALEVAHAAGLVHRDIKPANIVLPGGEVKVLGFGIAGAEGSAGDTPTLGALGAVACLSPEQASGRTAAPQSTCTRWAACCLRCSPASRRLRLIRRVGLAYRHVHDDPGPPSVRQSGVPARLDGITSRLAKDPADRPASAAAARADLLALVSPDATAPFATPAKDVVPSGLSRRRSRRLTRAEVGLAGALAAALVAFVAVLLTGTTGHAAPRGHRGCRRARVITRPPAARQSISRTNRPASALR